MSKFDEIKIPENIKFETKKTIQKGKRLKKVSKHKYLKSASIIILSVGVCLGILNPSLAEEIIFHSNLFESKVYRKGEKDDYTKYVQPVNLSKTVNGVTMTIEEVVYDGHKLDFAYTIQSENKLPRKVKEFYKENDLLNSFDSMRDDDIERENFYSRINSLAFILDADINVKNGYATLDSFTSDGYKDDYTYAGMQSYSLTFKGKRSPDVIKVDFSVNSMYLSDFSSEEISEKVDIPLEFKFKVSPNTPVKVIDVNKTENGFTIDSIEISPYTICVNVRFPEEYILDKDDSLLPSISFGTMFGSGIAGKTYENNIDPIEYKVKKGMVHDSVVVNNTYKLGYYDIYEYLTINFMNFKNQEKDDVTEFEILINE